MGVEVEFGGTLGENDHVILAFTISQAGRIEK